MHNLQLKQAVSSKSKVKQKILSIIKNLQEQGIENEFTVSHWTNACYKAGYTDYRTINKYLNVAEKLGIIANVRPGIFKIVGEKHE
jgi:putative N-acetylmannosamine-6-phosphate epimerase